MNGSDSGEETAIGKFFNASEAIELLFNSTQEALLLLEVKEGRFVYCVTNALHQEMTGYHLEDLYGKTPVEVLGNVVGKRQELYCRECLKIRDTVVFEDEFVFKGNKITLMNKFTPFFGENKKTYIVGSRVDITYLKRSLEKERNLAEKFNAMFIHHTAVMLLIHPETGIIVDANPAASEFYGYTIEELKEMNIHDINTLSKEEIVYLREKAKQKSQRYFLFPHKIKNGEIRYVDVYSSPIEYSGRQVLYSIIFDVTDREQNRNELKKEREEILYLSNHDSLTGLYNRRIFPEIWRKIDDPNSYPIGVIMGDINGLKITNDAFGHDLGDSLLITISEMIKKNLGSEDIAIRWGGDEFILLIPKAETGKVEGIISSIQKSAKGKKIRHLIPISISFGYALKTSEREKAEYVIQNAEEKMYQMKVIDSRDFKKSIVSSVKEQLHKEEIETNDHIQRIHAHCILVANAMHLSTITISEITLLVNFHDIGKVGVEKQILRKPDFLNNTEWEEVKRHSEIGYRIALNIPELASVADGILYHHEKWDGTGYPKKLKGEEIPLYNRIMAVAEAYDVMIHEQVYKTAKTSEQAKEEIRQQAGKQFDPEVVKVFLRCVV